MEKDCIWFQCLLIKRQEEKKENVQNNNKISLAVISVTHCEHNYQQMLESWHWRWLQPDSGLDETLEVMTTDVKQAAHSNITITTL